MSPSVYPALMDSKLIGSQENAKDAQKDAQLAQMINVKAVLRAISLLLKKKMIYVRENALPLVANAHKLPVLIALLATN